MEDNLFRLDVAADKLSVGIRTLKRWDREGKIALIELPGGHLRIAESEIVRLMGLRSRRNLHAEAQTTQTTPEA